MAQCTFLGTLLRWIQFVLNSYYKPQLGRAPVHRATVQITNIALYSGLQPPGCDHTCQLLSAAARAGARENSSLNWLAVARPRPGPGVINWPGLVWSASEAGTVRGAGALASRPITPACSLPDNCLNDQVSINIEEATELAAWRFHEESSLQ